MTTARYKGRFWSVVDDEGTLVCVYRRGAEEVLRRLTQKTKGKDKEGSEDTMPVPLGTIYLTQGAIEALEQAGQKPEQLLARHAFGDWGEVEADDWERNDFALLNRLQLISVYSLRDKTALWVVTEWDRSKTTVLLPEEY